MPITQIPFQDPVAPPEKPQPEQLGLYDKQDWASAYQDRDEHVPHLLIQLQDDLERSRWREAIWISIIVHMVLTFGLWHLDWIADSIGWHPAVAKSDATQGKNLTVLALPPDLQKTTRKPNTNILSDKDRIATSRHPELDVKELQKILATPPPGAPGMTGPRAPQPAPQALAENQPPAPQPAQQPTPRPQFQSNQTAQLQMPARPNNSFSKYGGGMTAGQAIQQATEGAAANRGGGGQAGDFGLGTGAHGRQLGALDILSDTGGWDYAPYIQRIVQEVRINWEHLMPESVMMGKKGKLAIEFSIMRDGSIRAMVLDQPASGDIALDRAAWGGITASSPFQPLPDGFKGPHLDLRFRFYYNPDKADLE